MAHRLVPRSGDPPLGPEEVVRRLRQEFAIVEDDREAGARHVDQMMAQFRRMNAPEEVIAAHRRMRDEATHVVVTDDPTSEVAYLSFTAMPGEGLFIGYHSRQHEDTAHPILERCAQALGYEIELV
jgi:hypothetical protein